MRSDTLSSNMFSLANLLMGRDLPKIVYTKQENLNRMRISFQQIELMEMDARSRNNETPVRRPNALP
jgi:hypothetical protein